MKQGQLRTAVAVILLGALVTGCGIVAKVQARHDMQASQARYQAGLAQNPQTPANCESPRLSYEADLRAYIATTEGLK